MSDGQMTLRAVQQDIARNWIKAAALGISVLAFFLISRRWPGVNVGTRPPLYVADASS